MDHGQGAGVDRIIRIAVAVVEMVTDEDAGAVIVAEGAPAYIVTVPIPVDPSRAPMGPRDPIPAHVHPPMPSAVMGGAPAPRFRGDPGPADDGIPRPSAEIVGPPIDLTDIRDPDIPVGLFIDPAAVIAQFFLVFGDVGRQVSGGVPPAEEVVPGFVPLVEAVGPGVEVFRVGEELSAYGGELFPGLDHDGTAFAGRFGGPFMDEDLGFIISFHLETIKAFLEDVEGYVRRMDFDALLFSEGTDAQIGAAFQEMDFDPALAFTWKDGEFHLREGVDPEVVPPAELDLGLSVLGQELVALDQRQVDLGRFGSEVRCPLDGHLALDIVQARDAIVRIVVRFRRSEKRRQNEKSPDKDPDRTIL
jgi:hypothetical protein